MEKSKAIEWMSNRDLARKHFNDIVKDFNLLEEKDFYILKDYLNVEIHKDENIMTDVTSPKIIKNKQGKIEEVSIRVDGTYFSKREAITFYNYEDGFDIGFCGWADMINSFYILKGFYNWLEDYIKIKYVKE